MQTSLKRRHRDRVVRRGLGLVIEADVRGPPWPSFARCTVPACRHVTSRCGLLGQFYATEPGRQHFAGASRPVPTVPRAGVHTEDSFFTSLSALRAQTSSPQSATAFRRCRSARVFEARLAMIAHPRALRPADLQLRRALRLPYLRQCAAPPFPLKARTHARALVHAGIGGAPPPSTMVRYVAVNPRGFACVNVLMQKAIKKVCVMARKREQAIEWAKKHPEAKRATNKAYTLRHHEECLGMSETWRQNNKQRVRDSENARNKKKVEDGDMAFILKKRMRARLQRFMKQSGTKKNNHTFEMIGIGKEKLSEYLSSLLLGYETLNGCDIDHVFPLEAYDHSSGVIDERCMHWSNMQPLPPADNGSKHDRLPTKAMAAKVDPKCWPDGVTMDMLPDVYPGWATPLRMHA